MGNPVFIIAEIGSVHDGSFGNALKLVELATSCGADAVKFQTHIADAETLASAPSPSYFTSESRMDYFRRTAFTPAQWKELRKHCDKNRIEFLSSPFSEEAVDLLEEVGMTRYKIPSGEVTNIPMLEKIAKLKKQVILSSGMSDWKELDLAVKTISTTHKKITILQCTSAYPCPPEQAGLNLLGEMRERYGLPVGLSDHTLGIGIPVAAAALGATVIEKHLTFSRAMYGSDAKHSLEPGEFTAMVAAIREVESALAHPVDKGDVGHLQTMKTTFEKSVVSLVGIQKGTVVTAAMIGVKKPGTGIPAARMKEVIGKKAARTIPAHTTMQRKDVEGLAA